MPEENSHNLWSVANNIVDQTTKLISSGNIIGAILLFIILTCMLFIWKYPNEELPGLVRIFYLALSNVNLFFYLLVAALGFSVVGNYLQYKKYHKEIERLTNLRSDLIHGLDRKDLKPLNKHLSSRFSFEE